MSQEPTTTESRSAGPPPAAPKAPCRVGWVAAEDTLGQLGPIIQPLAISLMDELVELHLFCPDSVDTRCVPSPPVEVIRHGWQRRRIFGFGGVEELASKVAAGKIRLLHALDVTAAGLARRVAAAAGVGYVVSSFALGDASRLSRAGRHARAVLAASEGIRRELMQGRSLSADRIYLLRPGVVRVSRPTCFTRPETLPAIVVGAELEDFGCTDAALEALADLKARGHACAGFIVGRGKAESRLRAKAGKLGLAGEISFVETQPPWQMTGILKAADIYVSPAPTEKVDLQSLLAMAAGVPVLSVSSPASDFLRDGRTTSQFKQADSPELTMRLLSLLEDHSAATGLAQNALEYLGVHHSPVEAAAKTAEVYRRAIAEGAAE